jgi:hypothetical protein
LSSAQAHEAGAVLLSLLLQLFVTASSACVLDKTKMDWQDLGLLLH